MRTRWGDDVIPALALLPSSRNTGAFTVEDGTRQRSRGQLGDTNKTPDGMYVQSRNLREPRGGQCATSRGRDPSVGRSERFGAADKRRTRFLVA